MQEHIGSTPTVLFQVVFTAAVSLSLAFSATIKTGTVETIYTNINTTSFGYDMSAATVKINDTELYVWIENGEYAFKKFRGTLTEPFKTPVWSGYSGRWTFPAGYPTADTERYRPWLGNIYKINETEYIGFVHVETAQWDDWDHITFVQGIGYSADAGDHWYYCGDVVRAEYQGMIGGQNRYCNMGGCAVIIVGEYFYQYFNDNHSQSGYAHAVARARISDVVAAARQHSVSLWYKYYNGAWNEPGMNGRSSNVIPNQDMHVDAVYCAPLGQYLIALYRDNKPAYATSSDGITWSTPVVLFTPEANGQTPYLFFAGLDAGASDDCNTVGSSFYMYFPDRVNYKVYRIPFTIEDGNTVLTPSISPGSGTYADSVQVSLSCATSGADIRYTTNGSDPTASSALYTGPFWLQSTASVKARGFKSGMTDSPVASAVFTIGAGGGNVYQASADFSGTQGYRHWTYRSSTGLLTWNGTFWAGAEQYLQLEAGTGHPGATGDAVRRWTAPGAGSIRITGMAADLDAGGGDGVVVSILKNGVSLWQRTIANGGAQQTYDLTADVAAGDVIDFVINKNSTDNYWDNTAFDPTITFTPAVTITNTRPGSYPAGTAAARGMAKYYTVTGVPVAGSGNPAGPGVYLMRTGAAVSKMVVIQ